MDVSKQHQENNNVATHHHETDWLDILGLGLSGACLVHCLALPFLITLLPLLGAHSHSNVFHWVLAIFIVPIASFAFISGFRKHHDLKVITFGTVGTLLVTVSLFQKQHQADFPYLVVAGSLILLVSHARNWWLMKCRSC